MGRAKLTMELIQNEKTRYSTFQKRKVSMKKKIYELSTLCDIEASFVVYGPKLNNNLLELEIWPVNDEHQILLLYSKYKAQSPEERKRLTYQLSDYFEDRMNKAQKELAILQKANKQAQYPTWNHWYNGLSVDQLRKLASILKTKLNDANIRYASYVYNVEQQLWWQQEQQQQQQQRSINDIANKVNPHELFGQTYVYHQLEQHDISNFVDWENPTPTSSYEPLVHPYNYQVEQHGTSTFDRHMDLISNQRSITYIHNDDYVEDTFSVENVVNGPSFMVEPGIYDEPTMDGTMESIGMVEDLIKAPEMSYYGEAMPMSQYMDYPDATLDQMHTLSQMEDHVNYNHFDLNILI